MRTRIKDPFDRLGVYARRQRRVQPASTNVRTLVLTTLNPDEILSANQTLYLILSYGIRYHPTRSPRWRSGHAVDCRSTTLRFKSGPWLSEMCVNTSTRRRTACSSSTSARNVNALRYKASKSNIVVIAAIAFGKHLVSFRTQQLSRNT